MSPKNRLCFPLILHGLENGTILKAGATLLYFTITTPYWSQTPPKKFKSTNTAKTRQIICTGFHRAKITFLNLDLFKKGDKKCWGGSLSLV